MDGKWTIDSGMEKIESKLSSYSLPNKPTTFGKDYDFPEDINKLTSQELGKWMFKLAAWKGYALRMASVTESEASLVEDAYNVLLAKAASEVILEKRINKELLSGRALASNPDLQKLKVRFMETAAEVISLKRVLEIYTMEIEIISREITRRDIESRNYTKGVGID